jgi:hypothetical protein
LPCLPWNINNPNPLLSKAHLTTLNLNIFKVIEAVGLRFIASRSLEWHYMRTKFHENLPGGSEVVSRRDRQADRLVI